MITKDTRIDYERISEIEENSVSSILFEFFGTQLEKASLDQKLVLLETIAYSLREGGSFRENLLAILQSGRPDMPELFTSAAIQVDEALKVMAILYVAITESYS